MCQPAQIAPQSAQNIIVQTVQQPECDGEQKLTALQSKRLLHLSEQTAQKTARFLRLLIAQ